MPKVRSLQEDISRFVGDRVFDHVCQMALMDPEFSRLSETVREASEIFGRILGERRSKLFDKMDDLRVVRNNRLLELTYQQGLKDISQLEDTQGMKSVGSQAFDHVYQIALVDPEYLSLTEKVNVASGIFKKTLSYKLKKLYEEMGELRKKEETRLLILGYQQGLKDGDQLRDMLGVNSMENLEVRKVVSGRV